MDKIKNVAQRLGIITVEDMERYTALELIMLIANKMNECQEIINDQNDKIQYLLNDGVLSEVEQIFDEWLEDGTFDKLINQTALKDVNERIDETNAQLSNMNSKKLDKDGIVTMSNMGQDVREAMTGGSVAVVGKNMITDENIIDRTLRVENFNEDFYEISYNNIKIKYVDCDDENISCSNHDDTVSIRGTVHKEEGCSVNIYVDKPSLNGDFYFKMNDKIAESVLGLKVVYTDGTHNNEVYINNSNVALITVEKKPISHFSIYIQQSVEINYSNKMYLVAVSDGDKNYVRKYTSKLITKDNAKDYIAKENPFKGKKWVTIGDSITYGYYTVSSGVGGRYQWQEKVANHFGMTFVNLGISGSTTAGFMRDEVKNNIPSDVDIITVMGGTNDYGQNVNINDVDGYEFSGGTYSGAIRELIRYLTTNFPNAKILFCNCIGGGASQDGVTLYEKNDQGKDYYDYARKCIEISNKMNIPCINMFGECGINLYNRDKFISDTVHPTVEGYNRIANVYIDNFYKYANYLCE